MVQMVTLEPIKSEDFEIYLKQTIIDYAKEKIKSGNWLKNDALKKSQAEFYSLLPDGIQTKDQFIYSILDIEAKQIVGVLWVQVKLNGTDYQAFICDFVINPRFRNKGYGRQALQALDEKLVQMNVKKISLHVFAHNTSAIALYEKMGFSVTNIYLSKNL